MRLVRLGGRCRFVLIGLVSGCVVNRFIMIMLIVVVKNSVMLVFSVGGVVMDGEMGVV